MPGQFVNAWWTLVALGICAGVLSGMLGLGSGILVIPALVLLFNFPQKSAQGTCLAVMVPMALVGAIRYGMNPQVQVEIVNVGWLAIGAVAGAFIGTELASRLSNDVLRKIFAVFMVIVATKMLLTTGKSRARVRGEVDRDHAESVQVEKRR